MSASGSVGAETTLRDRIVRKARESARTIETFFDKEADSIAACSEALAKALQDGARLFVMGNGGSACDAQHMAVEFLHPVVAKRKAFPAMALSNDVAHLTAVGNDEDFSVAYDRSLRLLAKPGDVAIGMSTSGKSANVNRALRTAREMDLITIGFAGGDGGRMKDACDHCFVVPSFSIHRIQEAQATLLHVLWDLVHVVRGEEDVL